MPIHPNRVQAVFLAAVELTDDPARNALLDRECGSDDALRERVERLLAAHREDSFLNPSVGAAGPIVNEAGNTVSLPGDDDVTGTFGFDAHRIPRERSPAMSLGTVIAGRYTLDELIGEGGMGSVYRASQTEPVKRQVALKLIKTGMDSKGVLASFDTERQALALMDHPNIARIYDGGVTPSNQPFFVMELVKGVPITEYCDSKRLTVDARLRLFVEVCQAVQHAHQKGIIHRDLKPSNVLVTEFDGRPTPKVIDFGVAKATEQKLTDQSFSDAGAIVGTPAYMSPEQADPSSMDIDTRTDVYALGVMLYELLTDSPPIDSRQFKRGAILEMLRMVREVEPPRPSTKLSTADALPNIAANRSIEPSKLSKLLQGELDWVVMKALEKDRTRRYDTANGFARDIQRYLADEVVEARPPSRGYRIRKFVKRNKVQVIAACLVFLALVAGVIGTTFGLIEARLAKQRESERADGEEKAKLKAVAAEATAVAEKQKAIEFRNKALDALRATTGTDVEMLLGEKKQLTANEKAYLEAIAQRWQTFASQEGTDEQSRAISGEGHFRVARLWLQLGRRDEARPEYEQAVALREKLIVDFPDVPKHRVDLALSYTNLGLVLKGLGKRAEAEEQYRKAVAIQEKLVTDFPAVSECRSDLASSHTNLGVLLAGLGKWADAEEQFKKAMGLQEKLVADFPAVPDYRRNLAKSHNNMGLLLINIGKQVEAEEQYRKGLALKEKLVADFPSVPDFRLDLASSHNNLGIMLADLKKWDVALEQYSKAITLREQLVAEFPAIPQYRRDLALSQTNYGILQKDLGKWAEAEKQYQKGLAIREKLTADFPTALEYRVDLGISYFSIGIFVQARGKPADAVAWFDKAIKTLRPVSETEPRDLTAKQFLRNSHAGRADAYDKLGKHPEAVKDWDKAVELSSPQEQLAVRASRATSRLQAGYVPETVVEAAELTKSPNWSANQWYDFACVYSLASAKIADKKAEFADRAMELLQKAVKAGYKKADHMKTDSHLDPLRERADFKTLIAELEAKAKK